MVLLEMESAVKRTTAHRIPNKTLERREFCLAAMVVRVVTCQVLVFRAREQLVRLH